MLFETVIDPAQPKWLPLIVFATKKDGPLRSWVNFKRINGSKRRGSYRIPRMEEFIASLVEAAIFSTHDTNCGYWQVTIRARNCDTASFTSYHGLYWLSPAFRTWECPWYTLVHNRRYTFRRDVKISLSIVGWNGDDFQVSRKTHRPSLQNYDTLKNTDNILRLKKS